MAGNVGVTNAAAIEASNVKHYSGDHEIDLAGHSEMF